MESSQPSSVCNGNAGMPPSTKPGMKTANKMRMRRRGSICDMDLNQLLVGCQSLAARNSRCLGSRLIFSTSHTRQHPFERRGPACALSGADDHVPQRFEFLPAGGIKEVFGLVLQRTVMQRCMRNRTPSVK